MNIPAESGVAPSVGAVCVTVETSTGAVSHSEMAKHAHGLSEHGSLMPSAVRAVPLLAIMGKPGNRRIIVGYTRVTAGDAGRVTLVLRIHAIWVEYSSKGCFRPLETDSDVDDKETVATLDYLRRALQNDPLALAVHDRQHTAARYAKHLAEASRNAVAELREVRYDLEHQLAENSAGRQTSVDHTSIVSSLIQLNIICGRAADQAREAVREGLWVHVTDSEAYHAYRRLQDPTIINPVQPADAYTRSWMRLHDAGMRQCVEMRKQLDAESATIRALLSSAASISSSREADAQTRFNTLIAVLSLGLGVPALVLALYGADMILPLNTAPRVSAFIPVAVGMVVAAFIAIWRAPRGKGRAVWWTGAGAIILVLGLLVFAGVVAPK